MLNIVAFFAFVKIVNSRLTNAQLIKCLTNLTKQISHGEKKLNIILTKVGKEKILTSKSILGKKKDFDWELCEGINLIGQINNWPERRYINKFWFCFLRGLSRYQLKNN